MMYFKPPQDNEKYKWTNHVVDKMRYYGISVSRIGRIIRFPKRKEIGVAPRTIAVMQPAGSKKNPHEVWVMYQEKAKSKKIKIKPSSRTQVEGNKDLKLKILNSKFQALDSKIIIISAWRYPGVSPVGKKIPIPDEILQELESIIY